MTANSDTEIVLLRAGSAVLGVAPSIGGSVTRYAREEGGRHIEWFRPASADGIARRDPLEMACFPLVPYCNRIRYGRFTFKGRQITLPANMPPDPSAIHGDGWQAPWRVIGAGEGDLSLEYVHAPDAWPWEYRAQQIFVLAPEGLTVTLRLTNESGQDMPAGVGLHPYFLRTPQARVAAETTTMWLADDDTLPTEPVHPPHLFAAPPGLVVDEIDFDNAFSGWDGMARISWPEWQAELDFSAGPPYRFLQLYTPPGRDFFCFEPVSNLPDPFDLAERGVADTGIEVLTPGETLEATAYFTPRLS